MKKVLLTSILCGAAATGVFAQGSVFNVTGLFFNTALVTPGTDATDPSGTSLNYFSGPVTISLWYAASSVPAGTIANINALDGTANGGANLAALLTGDGFTDVGVPAVTGTTVGDGSYTVGGGFGSITAGSDTFGLTGVPTGGSGWLAALVTGTVGGQTYDAVMAWNQANLGGNPNSSPAGNPGSVPSDPTGLNLVLEPATTVPEPGTLALTALGGASLLLFRRKK